MMTPGQYLKLRRTAARLSIADVAAMVHTSPRLGEVDRVAWLIRIEKDVAALSPDVIATLHDAYRFSLRVLAALIDLRSYGPTATEQPCICIVCGCSQHDSCFDEAAGGVCLWSNTLPPICTFCQGKEHAHAA